jgi:Flp pilus assembly protein protease CpaA
MAHDFFPNFAFAVVFAITLIGWLSVASYNDLKTLIVPKKITVSLLAVGVVMNVIRGVWLGADGKPTWLFDSASPFLGGLDGFLFAFLGFLCGFTLFFVMWIFGVCGGGDVKLAAAVGGWLGPKFLMYVLGLALVAVFVLTIVRIALAIYQGKPSRVISQNAGKQKPGAKPKVMWRLMSYSLPMTLGVTTFFVGGFWKQIVGLLNPQGG